MSHTNSENTEIFLDEATVYYDFQKKELSSSQVFLNPGGVVKLDIESIPSSGYCWAFPELSEEDGLQDLGYTNLSPPGYYGGIGLQNFSFSPKGSGIFHLRAVQWRPWIKEVAEEFTLTVLCGSAIH